MRTPMVEGFTSARWPYRLAVLLTLGAFNLITFNRYFPLTEGWWETYGYLYNSGLRPYRDFDLAFTPLFTIVNAGLLRLFGDSFFALRLFGVGVFLVAVFVLELLLEQFFSPKTAAVAVTVSTFLFIAGPQFIAKDYHSYQLGLVALSLLLHVWLASDGRLTARQRIGGTLLLGTTVSMVFFLKQNAGGLLIVAIAASLPLVERERPIARVAAFGVAIAVTLLLMLPIVSLSDWRQLLLANDAKGSLGTVLGRFLRWENRDAITLALRLCAAYALVRYVFAPPARWRGMWSTSFDAVLQKPMVRRAAFLAALVVIAVSGHRIRMFVTGWMIPVTLAFLGLTVYRVGRKLLRRAHELDPRWAAIALPLLALAYANTTTASFDFIAMHVPVALAMGWILGSVEAWASSRYWFMAALGFLVVVPELVASKLRVPYQWWGHVQGSIFSATAESDYPQLRGIHVTPEYRDVLGTIKDAVDTYSRSRTDVFFFSLPAFYWLHDKLPPYRTVVQWFDVVSSRQMEADLRAMRERPPRLVVALEPAEAAYVIHRRLRNSAHLPQEDFRALMDEWVASGKYRLVRSIVLASGNRGGREITQDVLVQNERSIGVALGAFVAGSPISVAPPPAGDPSTPRGLNSTLELGEVVTVRGEYGRVRALSETLGVARGPPRDWNTVNIYVREDAATGARPLRSAPNLTPRPPSRSQ